MGEGTGGRRMYKGEAVGAVDLSLRGKGDGESLMVSVAYMGPEATRCHHWEQKHRCYFLTKYAEDMSLALHQQQSGCLSWSQIDTSQGMHACHPTCQAFRQNKQQDRLTFCERSVAVGPPCQVLAGMC